MGLLNSSTLYSSKASLSVPARRNSAKVAIPRCGQQFRSPLLVKTRTLQVVIVDSAGVKACEGLFRGPVGKRLLLRALGSRVLCLGPTVAWL